MHKCTCPVCEIGEIKPEAAELGEGSERWRRRVPGGREKERTAEEEGGRASQSKRIERGALSSPPLSVAMNSVCALDVLGSSGD